MRVVIFITIIAVFTSCSNYSKNEVVLDKLNTIKIFQQLYPKYNVNIQGDSLSAGSAMNPYERDSFCVIKGEKQLADNWVMSYAEEIKKVLLSNGAIVNSCEKLSGMLYTKDFKNEGPDSFGARITFSISGSNGVIDIRYTTINIKDKPETIGYLSVGIIEFR